MKTNKFNFSDYDEVSRDEMRDMVSTSSGPLPPIDSGSGSGSGSDASPEVIACNGKTVGDECHWTGLNDLSYYGTCEYGSWHQGLYCQSSFGSGSGSSSGSGVPVSSQLEAQKQACRSGQAIGAACSWTWGGVTHAGSCYRDVVIGNICASAQAVTSGTATGDLSAREAACLGKSLDAYCKFIGDGGQKMEGKCKINNSFLSPRPLFCTDSYGVSRTEHN